ncbi:MAG: DUF4168 domain-containing protein [Chroococcales cyanobacterium]
MLSKSLSSHSLNKRLSQSFIIGTLTTFGLLVGISPNISGELPRLTFNNTAYAQGITQEEIKSVAQIILLTETPRQRTFADIERIMGAKPSSPIACHQPDTLRNLPRQAQEIAVEFCNNYRQVVESNRLSVTRFNEIIRQAQSDSNLEKRIQNAMIQLQQQG